MVIGSVLIKTKILDFGQGLDCYKALPSLASPSLKSGPRFPCWLVSVGVRGINVQDWRPHMSFIFKGSQISAVQCKGWFKSKMSIQEYSNEIENSYWTCVWLKWYMFLVQYEKLQIKHLTLLLVVTMCQCPTLVGSCDMHIILRTSSDIFVLNLRLYFEGLLWGRYVLKGQIAFEGHWRLQSWTLRGMPCHYFILYNSYHMITIFLNLGFFRHFETITSIRTWIKSHRFWRMLYDANTLKWVFIWRTQLRTHIKMV